MRIKQLTLDHTHYSSYHIRRDTYPKNTTNWHAHIEYELIHIFKGSGTLFIGDKISSFEGGQSILIGPNIPHYWLFNDISDKETSIDCVVIHFKREFAGQHFFQLPELKDLKNLLEKADKGLITTGTDHYIGGLFKNLLESSGTHKIINMLSLLDYFRKMELEKLVSDQYGFLNQDNDEKRMSNVMTFIKDNYRKNIVLEELASQAKMSKNSFCRYFKQKTGKTPIQLISELKISYACNLLRNNEMNLKEICFESGFNNFVSFHKVFKQQLNCTPIQFKKNLFTKF